MAIYTGNAKTRFAPPEQAESSKFASGFMDLMDKTFTALGNVGVSATQFEKSFVEDGTYDLPGLRTPARTWPGIKVSSTRRQYTQRPKATVFIKKKQFSALSNNYDAKLLDDDERLYLRCVKALFRRKCDEIAFYESLENINSIYETEGFLSIDSLFDGALSSTMTIAAAFGADAILDALGLGLASVGGPEVGADNLFSGNILENIWGFLQDMDSLRRKNERSKASAHTRWIDDPAEVDYSGLGPGVGVIELNMITNLRTSAGISIGSGSASMSIEDPYQLMLITDTDIEVAIRNATSITSSIQSILGGTAGVRLELARKADRTLAKARRERNQREITFEFVDNVPVASLGIVSNEDRQYYRWQRNIVSRQDIEDAQKVGITNTEIALMNQIMKHMSEYMSSVKSSYDIERRLDESLFPVRDRLRRDFLGQHLIQPMDQVTIFVNSNTQDLTPTTGAAETLNASIAMQSVNIDPELIKQERDEIAPRVALPIYAAIRKKHIFRDDGSCIFSGIAKNISDTYSARDGRFTIDVTCADNTEFLNLGRFTLNPDLQNTFGVVNDPLTPFDIQAAVDQGTGLIIDSRLKLSKTNLDRLKYLRIPSGPRVGENMTNEGDLIQNKRDSIALLTHTPGLVYKWKEGIVAATLQSGGTGGAFGGLSPLANPFAKLDAANIASILITGQPYDYGTFIEGVSKISENSADPSNLSRDFFNYLFDYVGKVNKYYGNFIPAKSQAIDRESALAYFELQSAIKNRNSDANRAIVKLQKLRREIGLRGQSNPSDQDNAQIDSLKKQIETSSAEIAELQQGLPAGIQISLEGNSVFMSINAANQKETDYKIKYRLKKKPEDVRFNQDKNFFIVDSSYDTEFVIQAVSAEIADAGRLDLFSAEYKTPLDIIQSAASALQLEFFADNDGNLVLRPPQYNKMPLSLVLEAMRSEPDTGKGILPAFIKNTLKSRQAATEDALRKNELEIAYELYSLGIDQTNGIDGIERAVRPLLAKSDSGITNNLILDESLVIEEMKLLDITGNPPGTSASSGFVFGPSSRLKTIEQINASSGNGLDSATFEELVSVILTRRALINGEKNLTEDLKDKAKTTALSLIDRLQTNDNASIVRTAFQKITGYLNNRRMILRTLADINRRDVDSSLRDSFLGNLVGVFGTDLMSGVLSASTSMFGTSGLPPVIEKFTENDMNSLDGPRSSRRFIINDDVILDSSFSHNSPAFTQVTVTGAVDFVATSGGTMAGIPSLTATATDFDLWRQYGFRTGQTIHRPDMTSAELQCSPYATLLLSNERRKLHSGSITVMGNEHYKLGDNVYIAFRGMVYYVSSVDHSVDLNSGTYTTRLTLEYGRAVGDIIPTPLDIAGSVPLGATSLSQYYQRDNSFSGTERRTAKGPYILNLGTLHVEPALRSHTEATSITELASNAISGLFSNVDENVDKFIYYNSRALENVVLRARARAVSSPGDDNSIEVRGYFTVPVDSKDNGALIKEFCQKCADRIKVEIEIRMSFASQGNTDGTVAGIPPVNIIFSNIKTPKVIVKVIDIGKPLEEEDRKLLRFPSEAAWLSASPVAVPGGTAPTAQQATAAGVPSVFAGAAAALSAAIAGSQVKKIDLPVNAFDVVFVKGSK